MVFVFLAGRESSSSAFSRFGKLGYRHLSFDILENLNLIRQPSPLSTDQHALLFQ
jgi:hypothetical protein